MKEIDIMLERWIPVNTIIREEFRNVIIKAMNEHADNMLDMYKKALDVKMKEQMLEIENDGAYSDDKDNITCCGDEITGLVKDYGLCPTCLEHI
jgi:hypothetical protein